MLRKTQIKISIILLALVGLIVYTQVATVDIFTSKALWCLAIWLCLGLFAQQEASKQKQ